MKYPGPKYPTHNFKYSKNALIVILKRFWPVSLNQSALAMAEAGFHYSGYGDIVICSYCGLNLYKWQLDDIPLVEHAKFNENCAYVSLLESKTSNTPISTSTSHCQNIKISIVQEKSN